MDKTSMTRSIRMTEEEKEGFKQSGIDFNTIRISVDYTKGGINYFTGNRFDRGYRIVFTPTEVLENGLVSSVLMGSNKWENGFYIFIEPATRFSRKKLEEIDRRMNGDGGTETLARLFGAKDGEGIQAYVTSRT